MDPFFLFTSAELARNLQMRQNDIDRARAEIEESRQQAILQETRYSLIRQIKAYSPVLLGQASEHPQRVYVELQIILDALHQDGVVPDSFDAQTEKEEIILMWRKCLNLVEKCQEQLSAEQLETCHECLKAIAAQNLIRLTAERLNAYHAFFEDRKARNDVQRRIRLTNILQMINWIGITGLAAFTYLFTAMKIGFDEAERFLIGGIIAAVAAMAAISIALERKRPRNWQEVDTRYRQSLQVSQVTDLEFWDRVEEMFGGIPDMEMLVRGYEEHSPAISAIFGESESPVVD